MTTPTIRPAKAADAVALAPRLRPADALELTLSAGPDHLKTLLDSLLFSSECFVAEVDGKVVAMGGFGLVKDVGIPWLVGSPEVEKYPVSLVAAGRSAVERWAPQCRYMTNLTHPENHVHHRWLSHLGFTFMDRLVPVGDAKTPFRQFYRYS